MMKNYAKDNIAADEKYLNHLDLMAELAHILKNRKVRYLSSERKWSKKGKETKFDVGYMILEFSQ